MGGGEGFFQPGSGGYHGFEQLFGIDLSLGKRLQAEFYAGNQLDNPFHPGRIDFGMLFEIAAADLDQAARFVEFQHFESAVDPLQCWNGLLFLLPQGRVCNEGFNPIQFGDELIRYLLQHLTMLDLGQKSTVTRLPLQQYRLFPSLQHGLDQKQVLCNLHQPRLIGNLPGLGNRLETLDLLSDDVRRDFQPKELQRRGTLAKLTEQLLPGLSLQGLLREEPLQSLFDPPDLPPQRRKGALQRALVWPGEPVLALGGDTVFGGKCLRQPITGPYPVDLFTAA